MTLSEEKQLEDIYVMHNYARKNVEFVAGKGMKLLDDEGQSYLDFLSGIGTVSLGHCHPALVHALKEQEEKLIHVSNYYYIEKRGETAELISKLLNWGVSEGEHKPWKSFFANSGAEANECAIKLARLHAKRNLAARGQSDDVPSLVVTLEKSFHGRTLATLAATAQEAKQEAFRPLPAGFVATPANDIDALKELFDRYGSSICAVMIECVQGESGVHPLEKDFVQACRDLTLANNAYLICDEVQCGTFRCGDPFAFQSYGVIPDVVTMAKGIGSGFPMGVCAGRGAAGELYAPGDHGSTFGGSCLAIHAAYTTLTTLKDGGFRESVLEVGEFLRKKLEELDFIAEVRGLGLMVGAELKEGSPSAPDMVDECLKNGLVINATGPTTLRFLPPLICTESDVDAMIEKLKVSWEELQIQK